MAARQGYTGTVQPVKGPARTHNNDKTAPAGGGDKTAGNGDDANANAKRDDSNDDDDDDESDDVDVSPAWTTVGKGGKLVSGNPHARVVCATCGRSVGGGAAGIYQHAIAISPGVSFVAQVLRYLAGMCD